MSSASMQNSKAARKWLFVAAAAWLGVEESAKNWASEKFPSEGHDEANGKIQFERKRRARKRYLHR